MAKAKTSKMPVWKKVCISLLSIFMLACVAVDAWYLVVLYTGEEKIVSNTYEVGLQETTNGDSRYFIELKYYSNANKNGLEMLDIKFNYLLDENQESFFSQGLQYVANSVDDSIIFLDYDNLVEYVDELQQSGQINVNTGNLDVPAETFANAVMQSNGKQQVFSRGGWYNAEYYYATYYDMLINETETSVYNYMSGNDYATTTISTNPINSESAFRIQLDDDLFLMKFKDANYNTFNEATFDGNKEKFNTLPNITSFSNYVFNLVFAYTDYNAIYPTYDVNYFAYLLYNALQSLPAGTNKAMVFEFGNMFDYYEYNNGQYSDTAIFDSSLLIEKMMSYYAIKVEVSADGAQQASDSLFNCIQGNSAFNLTGDYENKDYFTGRQVVNVDIYDFDLVKVRDNFYSLKLSEDFNNEYLDKANRIYLSVEIDLDIFNDYGYEFFGFTTDSGLGSYIVHDCYTTETINGQVVKTEVEYA